MELVLIRRLKVTSFIAKAEIQKLVKREELISILMEAEQNGGMVTPENIVNNLLANRPIKIGKRVIEWCASLGLLTWRGELTEQGKDSLKDGKVFISESGIYKFILTEDPLVQEKIVLVEPSFEGNLYDEVSTIRKEGREYRIEEELSNLPEKLLNLAKNPNNRYNGVGSEGEDIRILNIDEKGTKDENLYENFQIELIIPQYDQTKLILRRTDKQREIVPPNITFESSLKSILKENYDLWTFRTNTMKTFYEGLEDNAKRTFQQQITFSTPTLPNLGNFDPISLVFNLQPYKLADAEQWMEWLIIDGIVDYLDEEAFETLCQRISQNFHEFQIPVPDLEDIIQKIHQNYGRVPKYWYLQAPLDLSIREN